MPIAQVLSHTKHPVKIWTNDVEPEAVKQLENTASLPFIFKHVAVMPDVHWGMGATVGSVVATKGAVCPAAVGVDIGCGMAAMRLTARAEDLKDLPALRHSIERAVPVGFNFHKEVSESVDQWEGWQEFLQLHEKVQSLGKKARQQVGTLGGGNHFIEICKDTDGYLWIVLHSGSRHIGKSLADAHIETAKGLMKKFFIDLPDPDLAYFAMGTPEFKAYLKDLGWAQDYAMENRRQMMKAVYEQVCRHFTGSDWTGLQASPIINCHHNYAQMENHFGENVMVTRKGAVRAQVGDLGIIPGSMGTRSYIVEGLGNPDSFNSCSHGAGRRMSRKKAGERFTLEDLAEQTAGVECRKDRDVIDEIPGAYKPIEDVIENQSDLVRVKHELKQLICIKG